MAEGDSKVMTAKGAISRFVHDGDDAGDRQLYSRDLR